MKKLLRSALAMATVCVVFLVTTLNVFAYSYNATFVPWYGDLYYVEGSVAYTEQEAYQNGVVIVGSVYKELGTMSDYNLQIVRDSYGHYATGFYKSDIDRMQRVHEQCQAWCAVSMPQIVPNGTKFQDALTLCANWIADHMTYDYAALSDSALLIYYQSALPGFQTGKGVCATYATMFNTMVHWLPYNPQTDRVDYNLADPTHVDTKYIMNADHGWSAIKGNDGWYLYDITFYDGDDGTRDPRYLCMSMSAIMDGSHSNIESLFYTQYGTDIMAYGY